MLSILLGYIHFKVKVPVIVTFGRMQNKSSAFDPFPDRAVGSRGAGPELLVDLTLSCQTKY